MNEFQSVTGVVARGGENSSSPLILEQKKYVVDGFVRLKKVTTTTAVSFNDMLDSIKANFFRDLPWVHELPEFYKVKSTKIALVGGGPSLKDHLEELKDFDTIFACGSSHDFLVSNGLIPTYAGACDPDSIMGNYYQKPQINTKYLFATCCAPKLFEQMKDYKVIKWNCDSDEFRPEFKKLDPDFHAFGGGCTIGLRAISLAIVLGYKDIHFFGFDSCISSSDEHHAYEFTEEKEKTDQGQTYELRLAWDNGKPNPKTYKLVGYQLAQVEHFKQFYEAFGDTFIPTFHGEGLLPDVWNMMVNNYNGVKLDG